MPELPEIENLVRSMRKFVVNAHISDIAFLRDDIREKIPKQQILDFFLGQKILEVSRRGKYALLHSDKGSLGIHLGMSGKFVYSPLNATLEPHTHMIVTLLQRNETFSFRFIDPRRFGRIFTLTLEEREHLTHNFLKDLGIEPLDENSDLATHLFQQSRNRKKPVKNFLMDSGVVVGVGNIYASEALWHAKISPLRLAFSLSQHEFKVLASAIKQVLLDSIEKGGTTFRDYRNSVDKPGTFQNYLRVYDQATKKCKRCRGLIEKITQSGRATFFCPLCQS